MGELSTIQIIGISFLMFVATLQLYLGSRWRKDEDDPMMRKLGNTIMNIGKFMWVAFLFSMLLRVVWQQLDR